MSQLENLHIYSGFYEARQQSSELPIISFDMTIMTKHSKVNGVASIVYDSLDSDTEDLSVLRTKFFGEKNTFGRAKDGTLLLFCVGYPTLELRKAPTTNGLDKHVHVIDFASQLPNFKMMLKIDPAWQKGKICYKYRANIHDNWTRVKNIPIALDREGLEKVA